MESEWEDQLENIERKPAATVDPMKTSHHSNPFNKDAFLETLDLPVIAELNLMGQGTRWSIKSSIPTQTIVNRTDPIVQGDIMSSAMGFGESPGGLATQPGWSLRISPDRSSQTVHLFSRKRFPQRLQICPWIPCSFCWSPVPQR